MPKRGGYNGYDNYSSYYDDYFPASRPLVAKGGIKARSQRGAFGQSWWAKRWIDVLEGFDIGARLSRGRSYARSGQVVSIEISRGTISARVQGSRPRPYQVRIQIRPLAPSEWERVAGAIASQAVFAASLLSGKMPQDIEAAFVTAGASLFPTRLEEIETSCSCPDWSNPCKHIAAVYLLIGEEFDRDPFLLFTLRGLDRDALPQLLGSGAGSSHTEHGPSEAVGLVELTEPLPEDPAAFWQGQLLPQEFAGEAEPPAVVAALPRRIGQFPFWRLSRDLREIVEPVYTASSTLALAALAGERVLPLPSPPHKQSRGRLV